MGRLERKLERKERPRLKPKGVPSWRIITIQRLGSMHVMYLHSTKGWKIRKVRHIKNPNIILRKEDVQAQAKDTAVGSGDQS